MIKKVYLEKFISIIIVIIFVFPINVKAAGVITATSTPELLTENNLNDSIIHLSISGGVTYKSTISLSDIQLKGAPAGTTATTLTYIDTSSIDVTLGFNGPDFTNNFTGFQVVVLSTGLSSGGNINSNPMTIYANEKTPGVTSNPIPNQLVETNLSGSMIKLTLNGGMKYLATLSNNNFQLNNAPTGLSISSVWRLDNYNVYIILRFDGTNFDNDITNFTVTALSSSNDGKVSITSNTIAIKDIKEIEGQGYFNITGTSYPTSIQVTGYNSKQNKLYINFNMQTTKTIGTNQKATFYYYVEIFSGTSSLIGNFGAIDTPNSVAAPIGSNTVVVVGKEIQLNSPLPPAYRIVITVKTVLIS